MSVDCQCELLRQRPLLEVALCEHGDEGRRARGLRYGRGDGVAQCEVSRRVEESKKEGS